jgi:hypothetical protein
MNVGTLVVAVSATALLGTLPVSAQTTVDDFKSGSYSVAIRSGHDVNVQPGTMMGSYRYTRIIVGDEAANPRGGAGVLDIMEEQRSGARVFRGQRWLSGLSADRTLLRR